MVSEATFALAQEQLQKNNSIRPGARSSRHCFKESWSAKAGLCALPNSSGNDERKLYYYRCLGSDGYRHEKGPVCSNRPIRQDYLDEFVWREIICLLDEPALVRAELDRRMEAARNADPLRKRELVLRQQHTRLQNHIDRMVTAYQEELITLAELRQRMPNLRKQEHAVESELHSLEMTSEDQSRYLRLAETLSEFRGKLRARAQTLDIAERQRILRLVVQEILVGSDTIRIRHSIPIANSLTGGSTSPGLPICSGTGTGFGIYLLCKGSPDEASRFFGIAQPPLLLLRRGADCRNVQMVATFCAKPA